MGIGTRMCVCVRARCHSPLAPCAPLQASFVSSILFAPQAHRGRAAFKNSICLSADSMTTRKSTPHGDI